jgi:hypothetical protein
MSIGNQFTKPSGGCQRRIVRVMTMRPVPKFASKIVSDPNSISRVGEIHAGT